jgi:hypothetical protein
VSVLTLNILRRGVRVSCADAAARSLLAAAYGSMQGCPAVTDLDYTVGRSGELPGFFIERPGRRPLAAADDGRLLAQFDKDICVELQRLRPDLYFVHAAVLVHRDRAVMLVAKSGVGKSTLCWALLHHHFGYLSDELAPVDVKTLHVHPYGRALMVKREPPAPYAIAAGVRTSRGIHVPAAELPGQFGNGPTPLGAVFFLRREPGVLTPSIRAIGVAEAAARLYANTLNALAHDGDGLDAAIRITAARPCFELTTADLGATCALVLAALERTA